ncbi:hypothetical protein CHARACLAT_032233 [Characodon lateralis]|uniref:Uncharacterized protein n=1 Tax=Characodon lateralis TaxID=208331 RepID=A0ABU7EEW5_9TELE|nr:hypothetical protein [Characodon lateralis]
MRARAVWKERGWEEEGVIPKSWIKDKAVYWPPGTDASKAMQKMDKPDKNWRKFVLSKVKFSSMDKEECVSYELTTAAKDDEEQQVHSRPKRVVKKRTLEDFVEGINMK